MARQSPQEKKEKDRARQSTEEYKAKRRERESTEEYKAKRRAQAKTQKYKEKRRERESTAEFKAKEKAKRSTPEFIAKQKAKRSTLEFKAKEKARRSTPKYKAREKARRSTPKYKAKDKARRSTAEYKAKRRERESTAEFKARRRTAEYKEKRNKSQRLRYNTDPVYRSKNRSRSSINKALKNLRADLKKNYGRTLGYIGAKSWMKFIEFLELRNSYGGGLLFFGMDGVDVEIDHVHALSLFDLNNPKHIKVAWHYTNTQLLEKYENRYQKRNKPPRDNFNVEKYVEEMTEAIKLIKDNGWTEVEVLDKMMRKELPGYYDKKWWLD